MSHSLSILFNKEPVIVDDMGDIEFIREKVLSGDWICVTGDINAATNVVSYEPATGKTFFVYSAKVVITGHIDPTNNGYSLNAVEADLKIDGAVKDTTNIGMIYDGTSANIGGNNTGMPSGAGNMANGKLAGVGNSLVGNSSKIVSIENIVDNGTASATLTGWIEDT